MSTGDRDMAERLWELAADRAMVGLSDDEGLELQRLEVEGFEEALDEAELAAALGHESLIDETELQPMPAALAGRIRLAAPFAMPAPRGAGSREADDRGWWPWLVAAAAVLALIGSIAFREEERPTPRAPSLEARLASLEREAADLVRAEWRTVRDGYPAVSGRAVFSPGRQDGFMVLEGLPRNDPGRSQYQLWIVDPARDREPVDGGVFDVDREGRVVVPIRAKLRVVDPRAFVITSEQPGGVVVSEGPHLVLAAR